MNKLIIIAILFFASYQVNAQKKSEIVQAGIEVQRSYQQDFVDGESPRYLEKEDFYNSKGELIEEKEYTDKGKTVKLWFKYKYDSEGNQVEVLELDAKGAQKEKSTYKFDKGFKLEKLTYDAKNRLAKKKTYEYGFRK